MSANANLEAELDELLPAASSPPKKKCSTCAICCGVWCGLNIVVVLAVVVWALLCWQTVSSDAVSYKYRDAIEGKSLLLAADLGLTPRAAKELIEPWEVDDNKFGSLTPQDAVDIVYQNSLANGITSAVPAKLKGVYWMKGNPFPQVLTTFQHGMWLDQEASLLVPAAPRTAAWWGGSAGQDRTHESWLGHFMSPFLPGKDAAEKAAAERSTLSFEFVECPEGSGCEVGSKAEDLDYAHTFLHREGNITEFGFDFESSWSLKAGAEDGSNFTKSFELQCGVFSLLPSYQLVKIVQGNGAHVQPAYDEFLASMANTSLVVWDTASKPEIPVV